MTILNENETKVMHTNELAQKLSGGVTGEMIITEGMPELIRAAGAEGCVLLKNNGILPLSEDKIVSVFGRVQNDYFCVGYGSGGDVRTPYQITLMEGLRNQSKIGINGELASIYETWSKEPDHVADQGTWGNWPRNHPEMPLNEEIVKQARGKSDTAIVVIGRAAGEDRENALEKGSYYLTDLEINMLDLVTSHFKKVVVLLDCGNIIDMEWIDHYEDKIGAILISWLGGMESGNAVADVLTGIVNPSGRLSDTIARQYMDYPSAAYFGGVEGNDYVEDIFVGYRYFETFAPEKVRYPFGYGLSYTSFQITSGQVICTGDQIEVTCKVTNTGNFNGKEVIQIYHKAPQGKLGKPARVLIGFEKTRELKPLESQFVKVILSIGQLASYDDSGITGFKSAFVLEAGDYGIYIGNSSRVNEQIGNILIEKTRVFEQCQEVMAVKPDKAFKRMVAREVNNAIVKEHVLVPVVTTDLTSLIQNNLPEDIPFTDDKGYQLVDVKNKKITMEEFIGQLSLEDLEALSRGHGPMSSELGVKGNAGAFGGITESLRQKGIPPVITADGPAGIRIEKTCSLLPCGTLLACTFNTELIQTLFYRLGEEMIDREIDIILSPGMNIHRNPLCGRNFEYYSEDPYLSGKMATATVKGIEHNGLSACPKHFACNNQEINRNHNDSRVSERALREIYLSPFEMVVKDANPKNIMTSYNKINGVWSHYNYELVTTVLRNQWGYKGNVMTDWWMQYITSPEFPKVDGNAYRIRAQVDVLMPGSKEALSTDGKNDGSLLKYYGEEEGITLGEMQRSARNILNYVIESSAMKKVQ